MRVLIFLLVLHLFSSLVSAQRTDRINYLEEKVPKYQLPDPLMTDSGHRVTKEIWESSQRLRILKKFEDHVYGKSPRKKLTVRYELIEIDPEALNGSATRKQVAAFFGDQQYRIDFLIFVPNEPKNPVPGFVGINFGGNHTVHPDPNILKIGNKKRGLKDYRWQVERLIRSGYALATASRNQIDPDTNGVNFNDGIHPLFYEEGQNRPQPGQWGSIGAWAWANSRILDYLETEDSIDHSKIAVIGHSRLGKAALWSAAQDSRFAMAVSNNSGCGGAALYRRKFGERIHTMKKPFEDWFCKNHFKFQHKEEKLPIDQHMLLGLIAPRPLYVASATKDLWADPKGEFLSTKHASDVYQLYRIPALGHVSFPKPNKPVHTTIGYHLRKGKHDITEFDWIQFIKFADKYLK